MTDGLLAVIDKHWPWLVIVIAIGAAIGYAAKGLGALRGVWRPIRAFFRRISGRVDAELEDLRRQVGYLTKQVAELRERDEMTWGWILLDQEWHRQYEFKAVQEGWVVVPHISYMEYRDRWVIEHKRITEPTTD